MVRDLWALTRFLGKVFFWASLPVIFCYLSYLSCSPGRQFRSPTQGLTYIEGSNALQQNLFRQRTVAEVCDPLRLQLDRIKEIRRQTNRGIFRTPALKREATEIRNRLREIYADARLRPIPTKFKRHYEPAIFALQDAFHSINDLEDSFDQETVAARKKLYNHSIKNWKAAEKKNNTTHDFFSRDESPTPPERKEPRWRF